ncbi:MAG: hypothetical protein V3R87_12645, partial [Dehalococcoidia bacterium]
PSRWSKWSQLQDLMRREIGENIEKVDAKFLERHGRLQGIELGNRTTTALNKMRLFLNEQAAAKELAKRGVSIAKVINPIIATASALTGAFYVPMTFFDEFAKSQEFESQLRFMAHVGFKRPLRPGDLDPKAISALRDNPGKAESLFKDGTLSSELMDAISRSEHPLPESTQGDDMATQFIDTMNGLDAEESDGPIAPPQELVALAEEQDGLREEAMGQVAPQGDFSPSALNTVVDELNRLLPKFGITEPYEQFTDEAQVLPSEFMRLLIMVAQSAKDAALLDMVTDLDEVADDRDLVALAGKIKTLAESADFARFLNTNAPEPTPEVPELAVVEAPMGAAAPGPIDEEALFAART